ncbi:MAG: DUF2160 family membrane protein [Nitrososphaerota archaeon]
MFNWIRPIPIVWFGIAVFFGVIFFMYIAEKYGLLLDPSPRKGFLPLPTTPGTRFFLGLIVLIYIFLVGLVVNPSSLMTNFFIGLSAFAVIMLWG